MSRSGMQTLMAIVGGALLCAGCSNPAPGAAGATRRSPVIVSQIRSRPTPPGSTVGAVYLTIISASADDLVGVSVPAAIAGRAEMHEMATNEAGEMVMRAVAHVPVEPGKAVLFRPGGMHIMLFDLPEPLREGQSFPLTLKFARSGELPQNVTVRDE
jgi:periplasmic copper chaperone A